MLKRPGGEMASRPLKFFWLVDCSGSMYGDKIAKVNYAIQSTIPDMRTAASENPNAQLLVQTLKFSNGANWVTNNPVKIEDFTWSDVQANGLTDMGKAFDLVAGQLDINQMGERALPPVLVLLSDGQPTDDYKKSLDKLLNMPWGKKSVRIAIAIGHDADTKVLEEFTQNRELVLQANNPQALVGMIRWASTVAKQVSSPLSRPIDSTNEAAVTSTTGPLIIDVNNIPTPDDFEGTDVW